MSYLDTLRNTLATDLSPEQTADIAAAKSSGQFENWRDPEIQNFLLSADGYSNRQGEAERFYMNQQVAAREANTAASQDRANMLGELNAWKAGNNEDWIAQGVAREKSVWDAKAAQTRQAITQQYASMGRVADPLVVAEALKRVAVEASSAMQLTRSRLEQEQSSRTAQYLAMKNDVYKNTTRATMDPSEAAQIALKMGSAE